MANYFIETWTWNPWQNLAVEKYLSGILQKGDVILYLWQNDKTVVIGRNQNALKECRCALLEEDGGYLARRTTGGGAVYHDLGNLCFTFLASPEVYDLNKQLSVIQAACETFGIRTCFSGRNDIITEDGLKFSGNAFSVTDSYRIQHGTLMINVDVSKMGRYLTPSEDKMKSKGVKSVKSRVVNLKEVNPSVTTDGMRAALKEGYGSIYGDFTELDPSILDNDTVRETYELYSSWEWRYGKSPACEISYRNRFSFGEVEVQMKLSHMRIDEIAVFSDTLDVDLPEKTEKALRGKRYDLADFDPGRDLSGCTEEQKEHIIETAEWLKSQPTRSTET